MVEGRGVHRVLVGKPQGKIPLGRPRRKWEDNIKRDLQEVGGDCGNWMEKKYFKSYLIKIVYKITSLINSFFMSRN
jgi:hypothetical protein